jgi:hypothetical protein
MHNMNTESYIFWDIPLFSTFKVTDLPFAFMAVSCSANSSTLNIEAKCFSEMYVDFQRATLLFSITTSVGTSNSTK